MSHNGPSVRATLNAWRERQADRLDPVRFHFIEAMERRAANHDGDVRRILDDKLCALLEAYADDLAKAESGIANAVDSATAELPARDSLGRLIDDIAQRAVPGENAHAVENPLVEPSRFPELEALGEFRKTWSALHAESQLQKALAQVPTNAGPLNSEALVHRAIALMRELSPGYLQQFLAYIDTLSWMERINPTSAVAGREVSIAGNAKKRVRDKRPRSVK
ncbi:MAG: DUF2894 domain-containing protein [Rudaea sp.]|nr:DUF2894 domain-containing protein [Rudaea sp.]